MGKYIHDKGITSKNVVTVETLGGLKTLELTLKDDKVTAVTVDMGEPVLEPKRIPVNSEQERFIEVPVSIGGKQVLITAVSMGNPHAVVYVEDTDSLELQKIGADYENHPLFPDRTNTEFIQVIDRSHLKMRVWERGAGETLACGTGACAALVASVLTGRSERTATLHLLGGDLNIRWDEDTGHVFMTGPAEFVFDGEIDIRHIG